MALYKSEYYYARY